MAIRTNINFVHCEFLETFWIETPGLYGFIRSQLVTCILLVVGKHFQKKAGQRLCFPISYHMLSMLFSFPFIHTFQSGYMQWLCHNMMHTVCIRTKCVRSHIPTVSMKLQSRSFLFELLYP